MRGRSVVAVVSGEAVDAPLPCFALDDVGAIADFVAARAGLPGTAQAEEAISARL